jgi:TolB protein
MGKRLRLAVAALAFGAVPLGLSAGATTRADGARLVPITGITGSAQNPCWTPGGMRFVFTNFETRYNTGNAVVREVATAGGTPILRLSPAGNESVNLPGQCLNARLDLAAYASDVAGPDEIYVVPLGGGSPRRVTHRGGALSWEPSMSPRLANGTNWIVFESHATADSPGEIWKIRVGGAGLTRLTGGHDDRQPEWSPAGDKIVFQRYMAMPGTWDVLTMNVDGSHLFNVTNNPSTDDTDPSWSPSGKWIVYSSDGPNIAIANLFVISAAGGRRIRVTHYSGYDGAPGWSPDGASIAFESAPHGPDVSGNTKIWVIAAPAGVR